MPVRSLALLAFLLSGASTLIYQIVWIRWLGDLFGVTYHAITTVVTVFMVGLALGALLAGRLADRSPAPLRLYVRIELTVGAIGLCFPLLVALVTRLYHGLHGVLDVGFFGHMMVRFLLSLLILLPPTLAMGATLPFLARYFVRARDRVGIDLGRLYGANTLGAALGCALTGWVLVHGIGLTRSNLLAVALNGVVAFLIHLVARRTGGAPPPDAAVPDPAPRRARRARGGLARPVVLLAFFGSGFTSLGYELVWTRIVALLHPNLHSAVFTLVLTIFLVGTGLGSAAYGSRWIQRLPPAGVYAGLQLLAGALALASPYLLVALRRGDPGAWFTFDEPIRRSLQLFMSWPELVLVVVVLGGAAFLFGMTFPVGNRLVVGRLSVLGSRVGAVYFLSTIGGVLGSFVTGFLLLPAVSAKTALLLLGALNLALGFLVAAAALPGRARGPRVAVAGAGVAAAAAVFAGADRELPQHVFLNLPGGDLEVVAYRDGHSTTDGVLVRRGPARGGASRWLISNGEYIDGLGFGTWYPLAAHPDPARVLIIAFDTGHNSAMALEDERVEQVVSVDISDGQAVTWPWFRDDVGHPVMEDPRFSLVSNDARNHLATTDQRYEIIYQGVAIYANYFHLSTVEFFELCRDRLTPDGIFTTKLHPTMITETAFRRVLATFAHVFPSAYVAQSELSQIYLLMGSPDPAWRPSREEVARHWAQSEPPPSPLSMGRDEYLGLFLLDHEAIVELAGDAPLLWDDRPMSVPEVLLSVDTDLKALGIAPTGAPPASHDRRIQQAITRAAVPPARIIAETDARSLEAVAAGRAARWVPTR